ncbi:hypothetical protein GC176_14665 [bacterium]|nr:hypothetical protein [bacterium]
MSLGKLLTLAMGVAVVSTSADAADETFLADYGLPKLTSAFTVSGTSSVGLNVNVSESPGGSAQIAGVPDKARITSINGIDLTKTGPVTGTGATAIAQNITSAKSSVTNASSGIVTISYLADNAPANTVSTRVSLVNLAVARPAIQTLGLSFGKSGLAIAAPTGNALAAGLRTGDTVTAAGGTAVATQDDFFHYAYIALNATQSLTLTITPAGGSSATPLSVTISAVPATVTPASPLLIGRGVKEGTGPPVDYPEYLAANKVSRAAIQSPLSEELKSEVVSARVELYYFRDAHRAAQIINRRVRSYNRAAVTAAEQAAEVARGANLDAEDSLETKQVEAQRQADILLQLERTLADTVSQYRQALAPGSSTAAQAATLKTTIETLLPNISQQRQTVAAAEAEVLGAEQKEERTARTRFQAEVSAGTVDPDTYVPGNPNSWDPVAQVSISVIGEGVLFLRGPRQGVIEIRKMLDELDHPVGQVKIGVLTVQLNGESNYRMDNTVRQVEGNLSLGRFLTYVTGQLFARSVSETAREVAFETKHSTGATLVEAVPFADSFTSNLARLNAASADMSGPAANARRQAYLQAFFGDDFLWALYEIDPHTPLLDPLNKIVSLNSTDTLTLAEGLIYTGLAKDTVRERIMLKFKGYLMSQLPEKEFEWIRTTGAHKWYDVRWWGEAEGGMKSVYKKAFRNYNFSATLSFFERAAAGNNELNPFQRQLIRLVQLITLRESLQLQYDSLVEKRMLAEQTGMFTGTSANARLLAQLEIHLADLESQLVEAMDSLRGAKAAIDNLLKRAMVAMEDDVYAQFYNPALDRIRKASQSFDVELGVVERTTILTNNRAFAKVDPQSTYEFDLPKRDILLAEALKSAYALQQDIGPLLQDPSFRELATKFTNTGNVVQNVLPGLSSQTDQQSLILGQNLNAPQFNSELEKLIPNPAIYRFQNGTGYEVRPVIQPDGQSVVFDFNYMYTTDLLQPTNSAQKGLGRVKRHFIDTEVQLGNLEWREISRYEIALKAARNGQGVPLLQDIPIAGALFRPLPSDGASIQKNIIVGQSTIYPTIQDLLGLRPSELAHANLPQIVDLRNRAQQSTTDQTNKLTRGLNDLLGIDECRPYELSKCANTNTGPDHELIPEPKHHESVPCQCPACQQKRAALNRILPLEVPAVEPVQVPAETLPSPAVVPAAGAQSDPGEIQQTGFRKPVGSVPRLVTAPQLLNAAE